MGDCEACDNPDFDYEAWEEEQMAKHGWFAHFVSDEDTTNAHTHGFDETFSHPDVQILFPLSPNVAHSIFATIAEKLRAGEVFSPGRFSGIIQNYDIEFAYAEESGRTVLRCILPDKEGRFPGDPDCPEVFRVQLEGIHQETPSYN